MQKKKIHILGIAGTFMGGIAQLAKAKGFEVTGSDAAIYPPMSTQLAQAGIQVSDLNEVHFLQDSLDKVIIGNALSRGQVAVEAVLNAQQPYTSGPQWLAEEILQDRWVVAVAGTHGKTTTSAMIAWILEYAGLNPGFLIGGVPENFGVSARLGQSPFFVVEADEYDSAFFDKRSKFVHYRPRTCVLNNLEFDHADIFADLSAIQTQFHHLVRTLPGNGLIVMPKKDPALLQVIEKGCWTPIQTSSGQADESADWQVEGVAADGSSFKVWFQGQLIGTISWGMRGQHNVQNGLHALAASVHCGVPPKVAVAALQAFKGVKRRLTLLADPKQTQDITLYDDFAHHPTAIASTLQGVKMQLEKMSNKNQTLAKKNTEIAKIPSPDQAFTHFKGRLIAVFEPRSNTMRMGVHRQDLPAAFALADAVFAVIDPAWQWRLPVEAFSQAVKVVESYEDLIAQLLGFLQPHDVVVFMSNGSFGGVQQKIVKGLECVGICFACS